MPGFVANRLQHALWREAISIVEHGIADAATVDESIRYGFGLRLPILGPLENADMVGLDLTLSIHDYILPHLESARRNHRRFCGRRPRPATSVSRPAAASRSGRRRTSRRRAGAWWSTLWVSPGSWACDGRPDALVLDSVVARGGLASVRIVEACVRIADD